MVSNTKHSVRLPTPSTPGGHLSTVQTALFAGTDTFEVEYCIMKTLTRNVVAFLAKDDGPTAVEYAVMLALIVVVCIAAITALGGNANSTFSTVSAATNPAAS